MSPPAPSKPGRLPRYGKNLDSPCASVVFSRSHDELWVNWGRLGWRYVWDNPRGESNWFIYIPTNPESTVTVKPHALSHFCSCTHCTSKPRSNPRCNPRPKRSSELPPQVKAQTGHRPSNHGSAAKFPQFSLYKPPLPSPPPTPFPGPLAWFHTTRLWRASSVPADETPG